MASLTLGGVALVGPAVHRVCHCSALGAVLVGFRATHESMKLVELDDFTNDVESAEVAAQKLLKMIRS